MLHSGCSASNVKRAFWSARRRKMMKLFTKLGRRNYFNFLVSAINYAMPPCSAFNSETSSYAGLCETMVNGALKDKEMTLVPSWHPESLPHLVEPARLGLESSLLSLVAFKDEKKNYPFVKDILLTCHLLAYVIVTSFSAAHQSPNIEKGDRMSSIMVLILL